MDVIKSDSLTFRPTRTGLPFGRTDDLPVLSVLLFCNPASSTTCISLSEKNLDMGRQCMSRHTMLCNRSRPYNMVNL